MIAADALKKHYASFSFVRLDGNDTEMTLNSIRALAGCQLSMSVGPACTNEASRLRVIMEPALQRADSRRRTLLTLPTYARSIALACASTGCMAVVAMRPGWDRVVTFFCIVTVWLLFETSLRTSRLRTLHATATSPDTLVREIDRAGRHAEFGALAALHCIRLDLADPRPSDCRLRAVSATVETYLRVNIRRGDLIVQWQDGVICILQRLMRSPSDMDSLSQRLEALLEQAITVDGCPIQVRAYQIARVVPHRLNSADRFLKSMLHMLAQVGA